APAADAADTGHTAHPDSDAPAHSRDRSAMPADTPARPVRIHPAADTRYPIDYGPLHCQDCEPAHPARRPVPDPAVAPADAGSRDSARDRNTADTPVPAVRARGSLPSHLPAAQ